MQADATMPIGVVIERREQDNRWQPYRWTPVAAIAHAGVVAGGWVELGRGGDWVHYHAATLTLELFHGETEGYRTNLAQPVPAVFIILRPGEEEGEQEVEPFHVTVCPHEAMGYAESGEEVVEAVRMPPDVAAWVEAFVAEHHVEVRFKKRNNVRHAPAAGSRPRGRRSAI